MKGGFIYPAVLEGSSGEGIPVCIRAAVPEHLIIILPKEPESQSGWLCVELATTELARRNKPQNICFIFCLFVLCLLFFLNSKCYDFELSYFDSALVVCPVLGLKKKELYKQRCELGIPEFSLKGNQSFVYLSFQPVI